MHSKRVNRVCSGREALVRGLVLPFDDASDAWISEAVNQWMHGWGEEDLCYDNRYCIQTRISQFTQYGLHVSLEEVKACDAKPYQACPQMIVADSERHKANITPSQLHSRSSKLFQCVSNWF